MRKNTSAPLILIVQNDQSKLYITGYLAFCKDKRHAAQWTQNAQWIQNTNRSYGSIFDYQTFRVNFVHVHVIDTRFSG